jgi:hypothetical protein
MAATDRAVSESAGVAALIVITVVATASVGLSALVVNNDNAGDDGGFSVEFQYSTNLAQLTIFHNGEEPVQAGNVIISGPNGNVTWAELADISAEDTVEPGDQPVFVSDSSAYDAEVAESDTISVIYENPDGETVTLTWNEGSGEDEGDGPPAPTPSGGGV